MKGTRGEAGVVAVGGGIRSFGCVTFEMLARHPCAGKAAGFESGVQRRGRGQDDGV